MPAIVVECESLPKWFGDMDGMFPRMEVRSSAKVPHAEFFPPPPSPRGPSLWLATLDEDRRQLVRFWPVIQNMIVGELRVRYQRSILGFMWTLLNPLLMMVILSWVFSVLNPTTPNYWLFLFAGMVPWSFFSGALNDCAVCIIQNEGLIRKIYVPKVVFPLARVLIGMVTFVLSLVALFLLLWPMGARLHLPMLLLPVAIALLGIFTLGLGLIVATANTFFRDSGHLVSVFLQAWYFATPILFPIESFPESRQWRLRLNPAYYFIEFFHEVLYAGHWPRIGLVVAAALIAITSLGIGYAIFKCHEDKMVFRL
jgi:ABC-2 type transport system permease protein/lipopolysaccharide transport system permease protein